MTNKTKALQLLALGMAFGSFNEFPQYGNGLGGKYPITKSEPKKEKLPEWFFWKNVYNEMDIFCSLKVPEGCYVVFSCRALNMKNAERKAKNLGII